jgi:hypothetical protein
MKEGTRSSPSSCSLVVERSIIVFGRISRHHHTEYNALVRCVFCNISAHCSSVRICYELFAGGWFSIRAAYDAKIQEKPFQQYSLIHKRYHVQCQWNLIVESCITWCIPSIYAQDGHVRGVILGVRIYLHANSFYRRNLRDVYWTSKTIWCATLIILVAAWSDEDDNINKHNVNEPRASSSLVETVMRPRTILSNLIQAVRWSASLNYAPK